MKKLLVLAALILVTSAVVFAQAQILADYLVTAGGLGMPGFTSPQSAATQTRYRSAADNFIRVDSFAGVTFDKFYAMASYAATNRAQLGYATKIGSLYLGLAYGGRFWYGYTPLDYREQKKAKYKFYTFDVDDPFNRSGDPENRVGVLLGVGNMGFRFSFSSVGHEWIHFGEKFAKLDNTTPGNPVTNVYKSYDAERGTVTPQIAWGMAKGLTENGVQPYVILDLAFVKKYIKYEEVGGNGIEVLNSENEFDPKLTVGLGGYTVYKNDSNFRLIADFEYALALKIYGNEYSFSDGGKNKVKTFFGLNDNGRTLIPGDQLTEITYNGHLFTPALAGQWSGGPLALKFRLALPVSLAGVDTTPKEVKSNGDLKDYGKKTSLFLAGFNPYLQLGAQWKIVQKLTLNAGGRIDFNAGYLYTTDIDGNKEYNEKNNVSTSNQLTAGLTFTPTDNLSFEVNTGVSNGASNNINVFETGVTGLLHFTNFLVGVKF